MHNCKKIKDLILTDYTDTQLEAVSKEQVEAHLRQCKSCQDFAKEVSHHLIEPFEKAVWQEVPAGIWEGVKQKISQYPEKPSIWDMIHEWMEGLSVLQVMPALVSLVMVFFISSTIILSRQVKEAQDQEQGAYVEYMLSSAVSNQHDNNDLGTPIEQYFL